MINWSPPENIGIGAWWAELIPEAFSKWTPRAPALEKMKEIFSEVGFEVTFEPLYDEVLYNPSLYFDPKNFVKIEEFQRCDSTFNLATQQELEEGVEKMKNMIEDGTLEGWFQKKEAERKAIGQTINMFGVKK